VDRDDCRLSEAKVQGSLPRVSVRDLEGMRFARARIRDFALIRKTAPVSQQ
jgi:hypothetical protein